MLPDDDREDAAIRRFQRLLDLAQCLLYERYGPRTLEGDTAVRPQLLVGKIPDDLEMELPMPEDAEVLGSLVRSPLDVTVALRTALQPEEVDSFYRERLEAEGWEKPPEFPVPIGFEDRGPLPGARLTSHQRGMRLLVDHVPGRVGSANTVAIRLFSQPHRRPRPVEPIEYPIPELKAPTGSIQVSSGAEGSGSDGRARSYRDVATINYLTNPAEHYHRQLERAGWKLESSASLPDGVSSHSTWTFEDGYGDSWQGVLMVVEKSKVPRRYTAYMEAQWQARNLLKRRKTEA